MNVPTRFWCADYEETEINSMLRFTHVIMDVSQRFDGMVIKREFAYSKIVQVSLAVPFLLMDWIDPEHRPEEEGGAE